MLEKLVIDFFLGGIKMEENIVAIYKKIKLFENFYIFKFVEAVENVVYNAEEDSIQY